MNDVIHQFFGLNMDFNRFKDVVVNIIWVLSICGIGIELSPIKFNPIKSFMRFVLAPFRAIVKEELEPVLARIDKHGKEIDKLTQRIDEKEIEREQDKLSEWRWKILNFGDQLRAENEATKEMYDYIAKLHDKYIIEIKKNNLTNGVMDATWEYIEEKYKNHLKNNDFIG